MTDVNTDENHIEPPPFGRAPFSGMTLDEVPFGSPPAEPVVLEGEIPWELREEELPETGPVGSE